MRSSASTAVIRQWAREQGIAVGDRGRLAPDVLAAYRAASSTTAEQGLAGVDAAGTERRVPGGYRIVTSPVNGATGAGRRVRARAS